MPDVKKKYTLAYKIVFITEIIYVYDIKKGIIHQRMEIK